MTLCLVQTVEFADAATSPFADTVRKLYQGGYLNAVSVGFMPLSPPAPFSDLKGNFVGYEFTDQELLELSCVNLPANKNSLARAIEAGSFSAGDLEKAFSINEHEDELGLIAGKPSAKQRSLSEISLDMAVLSEELQQLSKAFPTEKTGYSSTIESVLEKVVSA